MLAKSIVVEFNDGPLNGAIRYYSSVRVAKAVASRYVNRHDLFLVCRPYCDIFALTERFSKIHLCTIG